MKNDKMRVPTLISAIVYGIFATVTGFLLLESIGLVCQRFVESPTGGYVLRFSPSGAAIPYAVALLLVLWALVLCVLRAIKANFSKVWCIVTSVSVVASVICFFSVGVRRAIFVLITDVLSYELSCWLTAPVNVLNVPAGVALIVEAVVFVKCICNRQSE